MAKVYIERAYIEDCPPEDSNKIMFHVKQLDANGNPDHILVGEMELATALPWILMGTASNGDLLINNSAGMENNKWNHITKEIVREDTL